VEEIRTEIMESRGEKDARYIRRLIKIQRYFALVGRILIYASLFLLPEWNHAYAAYMYFFPVIGLGVFLLGNAKILENMEIGTQCIPCSVGLDARSQYPIGKLGMG
jgi:hypothetical protein